MAFRTNKVPAIEERTVSGSSVSFNSAFALPLKACKVSFSATQSGSGDPSPSNPRAISGVSAIGLTANSTPVSVSLGDTRYGGELDVLTGILTVTHIKEIFDGTQDIDLANWRPKDNSVGFSIYTSTPAKLPANPSIIASILSDKLKSVPYDIVFSNDIDSIALYSRFSNTELFFRVTDTSLTTRELVKTWLSNNNISVVYELAEPITVQLSANELSSIIGNNTFSTDTGTLEITFADLQEKSASGAVASFNTALAMPLVNGEFSIEAYQEGTGDPSPSNVRAIHGFSEVNVTANNIVTTMQFGQEVYGGVYDSVSGVLTVTHRIGDLGDYTWTKRANTTGLFFARVGDIGGIGGEKITLCSDYKPQYTQSINNTANLTINDTTQLYANCVAVRNDDYDSYTETEFKSAMTGVKVVYQLATPIEVQLTPEQITTIIGNNTIFADTGDIDLTFKDLDIAKRGNFREVFKLPS